MEPETKSHQFHRIIYIFDAKGNISRARGGMPLACIVVPAGRSACPAARWRGAPRSTKQNTTESTMKSRAGGQERGVKEGAAGGRGPRETARLPGWVPPLLLWPPRWKGATPCNPRALHPVLWNPILEVGTLGGKHVECGQKGTDSCGRGRTSCGGPRGADGERALPANRRSELPLTQPYVFEHKGIHSGKRR